MHHRTHARIGLFALLVCTAIAACRHRTNVTRDVKSDVKSDVKLVLPHELPRTKGVEFTESELALKLVCTDSLGMDATDVRVGRCTPCIPMGMATAGDGPALRHARALWTSLARAPYDTLYFGPKCVSLAYQLAKQARPDDPLIDVEFGLFRLASANDSLRTLALARIDSVLDSLVTAGRPEQAEKMLGFVARTVWDRAQRMLERPGALPLNDAERDAHDLAKGAPPLKQLPPLPRTSSRLGVSESEWAARLFHRTALLAGSRARASAWRRLALAPWVVLERWPALDSAANAMLTAAPNDSAVLPARALANFHRIKRPVYEAAAVMALFDSAMTHMPRADSLRYDSFDDLLAASDDEWRYRFLPNDRERLDQRGWRLVDPMWSTDVNEIRLAKRARVAEADYRYADVAEAGQAGSETPVGQMLLRRGPMDPAWQLFWFSFRRIVRRGWDSFTARATIDNAPDLWRAFYSGRFAAQQATSWGVEESPNCQPDGANVVTIYTCARGRGSDWSGTPFWGQTDTIDVSAARFRAHGDSVDIVIGARVPVRRFSSRDEPAPPPPDSVRVSAWLATPLGEPLYHSETRRRLPSDNEIAWTAQWTPRTGEPNVMHRVEAMQPGKAIGARGALIHTSDAQVSLALRGPGMSDILVAANAKERGGRATRWSDFTLEPNGAVVAPRAMFSLLWEMYDLKPAPDGRVRWRVSVHRETGVRKRDTDVRGLLQGDKTAGDRIIANERDVPAVLYTRDAVAAPAIAEHLRFSLSDVPEGRHVVEVRIEDLVAKRTFSRSVSVRVLDPKAQERGRPVRSVRP